MQGKILGKTEPVPPRIHMQISFPVASSNCFPFGAGEGNSSKGVFQMMHHKTHLALFYLAFLCVYLAYLVMFHCKNSPDKQLTKRNVYLKR